MPLELYVPKKSVMFAKHSNPSVLRNSVWNGIAAAVPILLLIFTTPIYLNFLGQDKFGLYMLLAAVTAPFDVLSAGIAQATIKHLAAWLPDGRLDDSRQMLRLNILLNLTASFIAVGTLFLISPFLAKSLFRIAETMQGDAMVSFRLAGVLWSAKLIGATVASVTTARQNFRLLSIVQMASMVMLYLGGLPVVMRFQSVASLQVWSIFTSLCVIVFWIPEIVRMFGWRVLLPGFDRLSFQRSFRFSMWQMLNAFLSIISQQADRIFVGALLGTAASAVLGIAVGLQQRAVTLSWSLFGSLFPALSKHSETNPRETENIFFSKGPVIMLASCLMLGTGVIFSQPFCQVWLKPEQAREVAPLLALLFFIGIFGLPYALVLQLILALGRTRILFIGNIAFALVGGTASWLFITHYGLIGAAFGPFLGLLAAALPLHFWICRFHMQSGGGTLRRMWSIYSLPVISCGTLLCLAAIGLCLPPPTQLGQFVRSLIALPVFVALVVQLDFFFSTHRKAYKNLICTACKVLRRF